MPASGLLPAAGQRERDRRAPVFHAFDRKPVGLPVDVPDARLNVRQRQSQIVRAHAGLRAVLLKQPLSQARKRFLAHADPVVRDDEAQIVFTVFFAGDAQRPAAGLWLQSVIDRVFDQRLQDEARDLHVH